MLLAASSASVCAQGLGVGYTEWIPLSNLAAVSTAMNAAAIARVKVQAGGAGRTATGATGNQAALTRAPGATADPRNAQALAAGYPANKRAEMARVFRQSFDAYRKLEAQLRLPRDDVAAAVAAFIAGNYMALRNLPLPPDADFLALVAQLRVTLGASPAFISSSARLKRQAFEQFAMQGMFMAASQLALMRKPDPAADRFFRDHARANLEQVLKIQADKLLLTHQGLQLR